MMRASIAGLCNRARPLMMCSAALAGLFCLCSLAGLRINTTGSLPMGIYAVSTAATADLVEFCPPAPFSRTSVVRGYRSPGNCPDGDDPLLKPVVAKAGDTVLFSGAGLEVNGILLRNTAPRAQDRRGRPLSHYPFGAYRVSADIVWVASTYHLLSFDSRYFGPIPIRTIRNHLKPFLTL
jgi:conjugative transfer signal peptidase TraF